LDPTKNKPHTSNKLAPLIGISYERRNDKFLPCVNEITDPGNIIPPLPGNKLPPFRDISSDSGNIDALSDSEGPNVNPSSNVNTSINAIPQEGSLPRDIASSNPPTGNAACDKINAQPGAGSSNVKPRSKVKPSKIIKYLSGSSTDNVYVSSTVNTS